MNDALLIQLLPSNTKAVETLSPVGAHKVVPVILNDWYWTRQNILDECCRSGQRTVIFVHGHAELYERRHGGRPSRITPFGQHGLWLYMNRLLQRFGHVYVPHIGRANKPAQHYNVPCEATVVGYQVAALQKVDTWDGPLGQKLCSNGYDSFTVNDYFYHCIGSEPFREPGTHESWNRAFVESYQHILMER